MLLIVQSVELMYVPSSISNIIAFSRRIILHVGEPFWK